MKTAKIEVASHQPLVNRRAGCCIWGGNSDYRRVPRRDTPFSCSDSLVFPVVHDSSLCSERGVPPTLPERVLFGNPSTEAGGSCRLTFQCRKASPDTSAKLTVFWDDKRVMHKAPTDEWIDYSLTLEGTGNDLLKFQRTGSANICHDAVRPEAAQ